jgi:phospholipid/cholesterol/gamma-HCH transport system substrate-binding protein
MLMQSGTRVPDTTSAFVQPLSVFGPKYINLMPGAHETGGPFLPAGGTIRETTAATEFLDVINTTFPLLTAINPNELATVVQSVANGLDGLGPDLAQIIDSLKTIADHAQGQVPNLQSLLSDAAKVTGVLSQRGGELVSLSQNLNQILPDISTRADRLTSVLDGTAQLASDLAGLLEGHRQGLDNLINGLSPVVAALYPVRSGVPVLVQTLAQFFGLLGGIIRQPDPGGPNNPPNGLLAGALKGYLPSNPCTLLQGLPLVCP